MAKAEELEKDAEKVEEKKVKPLPALVSPTVNLVIELRQAIAVRCRETKESFSVKTNKMWFDLLKQEGKVKPDLKIDFSARSAGGGGLKKKIVENEATIAELRAEIEKLKASKVAPK